MASFGSIVQLFCCNTTRRRGKVTVPDSCKVRIRMGFDGKEMLLDPLTVNIKSTFGCFAVLLDDHNQLVPLRSDGTPVEPLEIYRKYTVVANSHGSSKLRWDDMRLKGKHKHKHKSRHGSSRKKKCSSSSTSSGDSKRATPMKDVNDMVVRVSDKIASDNGCDEYSTGKEPLLSKNVTLPPSPPTFATVSFGVASSEDMLLTVDDMLSMNHNMGMNLSLNMNARTELVM